MIAQGLGTARDGMALTVPGDLADRLPLGPAPARGVCPPGGEIAATTTLPPWVVQPAGEGSGDAPHVPLPPGPCPPVDSAYGGAVPAVGSGEPPAVRPHTVRVWYGRNLHTDLASAADCVAFLTAWRAGGAT